MIVGASQAKNRSCAQISQTPALWLLSAPSSFPPLSPLVRRPCFFSWVFFFFWRKACISQPTVPSYGFAVHEWDVTLGRFGLDGLRVLSALRIFLLAYISPKAVCPSIGHGLQLHHHPDQALHSNPLPPTLLTLLYLALRHLPRCRLHHRIQYDLPHSLSHHLSDSTLHNAIRTVGTLPALKCKRDYILGRGQHGE